MAKDITILAHDTYEGYEFLICHNRINPTAYVKVPDTHPFYGKNYDEIDINVHGGLTFSGDRANILGKSDAGNFWIGWDYGHLGDYLAIPQISFGQDGHQWSMAEILEHVKDVIGQLAK